MRVYVFIHACVACMYAGVCALLPIRICGPKTRRLLTYFDEHDDSSKLRVVFRFRVSRYKSS